MTGSPRPALQTAIKELTKGRELASHLFSLLVQEGSKKIEVANRSLVEEILCTFSRALILLDSDAKPENDRDNNETKEPECVHRKTQSLTRGGYRRRRLAPDSSTKIRTKKLVDGHTWRKYGQKEIMNAKFPRSYFRCTHKQEQGCQATKHVQQSEDDLSTYVVTYIGEHTCTDPIEAATALQREPSIISFGCDTFPNLKRECKEVVVSNINTPAGLNSSTDYAAWLESGSLEGSVQVTAQVAGSSVLDQCDVISGLQSSADNLKFGLMEGSFGFNNFLCADDQNDFFQY